MLLDFPISGFEWLFHCSIPPHPPYLSLFDPNVEQNDPFFDAMIVESGARGPSNTWRSSRDWYSIGLMFAGRFSTLANALGFIGSRPPPVFGLNR